MSMDTIRELIQPELLVLIPVLYCIGMAFKKAESVMDKNIPILLGLVGIVLATVYIIASTLPMDVTGIMQAVFGGITQGVLCAGCSVYVNQIIKQSGKGDSE